MQILILSTLSLLCLFGGYHTVRLIAGAHQVGLDLQADENCGQLVVNLPWEDVA